jgi:hypothetical protein
MTNWNDIRNEIEKKALRAAPCEPEPFWSDFKARARLSVQDAAAPATRPVLWASIAFAGSLALAALVALPFFWAPESMAGGIQVVSLEVGAPHSGAMILNVTSEDGKNEGAIVWVSGLEESHENAP